MFVWSFGISRTGLNARAISIGESYIGPLPFVKREFYGNGE